MGITHPRAAHAASPHDDLVRRMSHAPSGVGGGGGLPSPDEGRKELVSSSLLPEGHAVAVADALRDVGVYTISRSHRERLAADLVREGVTAQEVVDLAVYLGSLITEHAKAQRTIAGRLTDAHDRAQAFADLRAHHAARAAMASRTGVQSSPGETLRREDVERMRAFESAWRQYQDDVAAGRIQPTPRRRHPWERAEEVADALRSARADAAAEPWPSDAVLADFGDAIRAADAARADQVGGQ